MGSQPVEIACVAGIKGRALDRLKIRCIHSKQNDFQQAIDTDSPKPRQRNNNAMKYSVCAEEVFLDKLILDMAINTVPKSSSESAVG